MNAIVLVKSATTGELLANVSVKLLLGDEFMVATTDSDGRALFTLR